MGSLKNIVKYISVGFVASFFWAFIAGVIIAKYEHPESIYVGVAVLLFGSTVTSFIYDFFLKSIVSKWFDKKKS